MRNKSKRKTRNATLLVRHAEKEKYRENREDQWSQAKKEIHAELFRLIGAKLGDPANKFTNDLAERAQEAVSVTRVKTPKGKLKDERASLIGSLKKARTVLVRTPELVADLSRPPGEELQMLEEIMRRIAVAESRASSSSNVRVDPIQAIRRKAAVAMVVAIIPMLKVIGVPISTGETSISVRVIGLIGERLNLKFAPLTWKSIIIAAKKAAQLNK